MITGPPLVQFCQKLHGDWLRGPSVTTESRWVLLCQDYEKRKSVKSKGSWASPSELGKYQDSGTRRKF